MYAIVKLSFVTISLCTILVACNACGVSRTKAGSVPLAETTDTVSHLSLGNVEGQTILITRLVDFGGKQCYMPEGYTLEFRGGCLKNGTLKGNKTRIISSAKAFLDHITIKGSWDVPEISSEFFKDLSYDNAVRNVVALSNPGIQNKIVIKEGVYPVSVQRASETCLLIGSNTEFVLNGTIRLVPNDFKSYYIVKIEGENVDAHGNGTIIGDKDSHTGNTGEWGMGIEIDGARNAFVSGLTIKDCWGDCIYIGGDSKKVTIENCVLDNGRRQGVSITSADSVTIRNCTISNVGGTNPEYAIDVEPNINCSIDHVLIENVVVHNCVGGIVTSKGRSDYEKKRIGEVRVINCTSSAISKSPIRIKRCEKAIVEGCTVYDNRIKPAISTDYSIEVSIENNTIINNSSTKKRKSKLSSVRIVGAEKQMEYNNRIVE